MLSKLFMMTYSFRRDRRGAFALWLAVALVPLVLFAGAGLDLMRAVDLRTQLQAVVDSAALAGATAYTSASTSSTATSVAQKYIDGAIDKLTSNSGVSYTISPGTTTSGNATLYTIKVTATSSLPTTLMKMAASSTPVKVTATAQNATYTITSTLSGFYSNAADANTIYWYIVPGDGGVPSSSTLTQLYTNTKSNNTKTVSATIAAGQKMGFALKNVTGGINGYGRNGYGGAQGSTHWFYSHMMSPSTQAYSSVSKDCSLQVLTSGSSDALKSGSCLSALPLNSAVNCSASAGKTMTFYWNDMGGGSDDYDYNDASYKIECSSNQGTNQSGVILIK